MNRISLYRTVFLSLVGACLGAWVGFALLFYGYLMLNPPGASGVEFETASPLGFFVGGPVGMIVGLVAGYRVGRRMGANT